MFAKYPVDDGCHFWLRLGSELFLAESEVVPGRECSVEIDQVAIVTPCAQMVA